MPPKRRPPDDPREWLNRARGNLVRAKATLPGVAGRIGRETSPVRDAWRRFQANRLGPVGLIIVLLLVVLAVGAPVIAPYPYDKPDFAAVWLFPSKQHLMGTDGIGRDFFSRIVYGARTSLAVGLSAQVIALTIGITFGMAAGMRGGRVDFFIMRLVDAVWAFPRMLFAFTPTRPSSSMPIFHSSRDPGCVGSQEAKPRSFSGAFATKAAM